MSNWSRSTRRIGEGEIADRMAVIDCSSRWAASRDAESPHTLEAESAAASLLPVPRLTMLATALLESTTCMVPSDREIVISRVVDAPRHLVWEAYTNPEHLRRWLGSNDWTMSECDVDLRAGGSYRFVWRSDDGREIEAHGEYCELIPSERLVSAEPPGGEWPARMSALTLTDEGGRTRITLEMIFASRRVRDAVLESRAEEGAMAGVDPFEVYVRGR
jgi:uncharacterized protein YndB with AHSA1/START domain